MQSHRSLRYALVGMGVVIVALIVWVDLSTDLWQKYVVMSGLAGGLITFVLSALVIDRLIARSAHERWAPVTRLALGDLRRQLSAEPDHHDVARARRLPEPAASADLTALIEAAAAERDALAATLAQWSSFLAASADVTDIMDGAADVAERLDRIGEVAVEARRAFIEDDASNAREESVPLAKLRREIDAYHAAGDGLLEGLVRRVSDERRSTRGRHARLSEAA